MTFTKACWRFGYLVKNKERYREELLCQRPYRKYGKSPYLRWPIIDAALAHSHAFSCIYSTRGNNLHTKWKTACNNRSRSEIVTDGFVMWSASSKEVFAKLP